MVILIPFLKRNKVTGLTSHVPVALTIVIDSSEIITGKHTIISNHILCSHNLS